MEKQTKSGKKRRSKPETLKLKNIVVGGMSKFYEQIPIILPFIFSSLEDFQIKNLELKHDIQEAMTAIKKIEELESVKKSVSPAYRSYDYYPYIDKLNRIIAKKPIPIRAVFSKFAEVARKTETINKKVGLRVRLEKLNKAIENLQKIKKFPLIKFYPDPHNDYAFPEGCIYEEGIRYYLTVGLLDYLQRLILGEACRTHQCLSCEEWFLATRANNVTCGKQICKERYWREARGGRTYRREFMQDKRRKERLNIKLNKLLPRG